MANPADRARRGFAGVFTAALLLLGACAHHEHGDSGTSEEESQAAPQNYKAEILAGMHVYLNDPTGIRDASIAQPAVKEVGGAKRYVVCLRFNAKQNGDTYAGLRAVAAVFVRGRFDRFVEKPHEQCDDAVYAPFPELSKLSR